MPTRDKDDKPATEHSATADVAEGRAISESRRKLIRASAAVVPAIMTIRSGAAVALTSMHQCPIAVARKVVEDPPALVLDKQDALDEWVRVRGVEVNIEGTVGQGSTTYYCVETMPGTWECWDTSGMPADISIGKDEISAGEDVNLLGYVDPDGNYTYYPKIRYVSDQAASPITASCLCSLHPEMEMCQKG